jgi:predicted outer membrane repeat protein
MLLKRRWRSVSRAFIILGLPLLLLGGGFVRGTTLYVDDDAPPGGDGLSWGTAFRFLQDALAASEAGGVDEIRVGQGEYRPDQDEAGNVTPGDREATFHLIDGVALRGGYAGFGAPDPDERDVELYETILTGDLAGNDEPAFINYDENSYRVVTAAVAGAPVFDGFSVVAGNADDLNDHDCGAGFYCVAGAPSVAGSRFTLNRAVSGGAMYVEDADPAVSACCFTENLALEDGGALSLMSSTSTLAGCEFTGNIAQIGGAAMARESSELSISDCLFQSNDATETAGYSAGGALYIFHSAATLTSCTFTFNTSAGSGGAVTARDEASLTFDRCVFEYNLADSSGGGVSMQDESTFSAIDCAFEYNYSFSSGGGFHIDYTDGTVSNCSFLSNISQNSGGGIYMNGSGVAVQDCAFVDNGAAVNGGGLHASAASNSTIAGCLFDSNAANEGGGLSANGPAGEIADCEFIRNWAIVDGGGLWSYQGGTILQWCTFVENSACEGSGGGAFIYHTITAVANCRFHGNAAPLGTGGAMYHKTDSLSVTDSIFSGNTALNGGAVYRLSATVIARCTVAGNAASAVCGGVYNTTASVAIRDCILWGNEDGGENVQDAQVFLETGNINAGYCCVAGLTDELYGPGNIDADPLFVADPDDGGDGWGVGGNDDYGDLHLTDASPCVNRGDPAYQSAEGDLDMDGEERLQVCRLDIGADESPYAFGDCNENGIPDACDIVGGVSEDCNFNGVPDECDIDEGVSEDCNDNGIPDSCEVIPPVIDESSGPLAPIGTGAPQTFFLVLAPDAGEPVLLTFAAHADLNTSSEYIDVELNDVAVGRIYETGGEDCADPPIEAQLLVPAETFNDAAQGGPLVIEMLPSSGVNPTACAGQSFIVCTITYAAASPTDLNENGELDECECLADCADPPDGVVDVADLLALLAAWGQPDSPCDINFDGFVGTADLLLLLAAWGPCP